MGENFRTLNTRAVIQSIRTSAKFEQFNIDMSLFQTFLMSFRIKLMIL